MEEHNPHRSSGKTMLILAWVCVLGLLTMVFADWEEQQYHPNRDAQGQSSGQAHSLQLQANRQHHYLVDGLINGEKATLLLDTGATAVVIPEALARRAGLKRLGEGYAQTANGRIRVYHTRIERLQFGPIVLRNVTASINPAMDDEVLLGMSALKQLELIQRGDTLELKQYRR